MEVSFNHDDQLLVVGGTGFIGQHVVKKALAQGLSVTVLSKNSYTSTDKLDGISYLSVDISHKASLLAKLENRVFDYVINLGGYIDHANYSNGGDRVYDVHFNGVRNLVECLNRSKIKGFVQIGSSDEYGNNPAPQSEYMRESPISPYSFSKVCATHLLQMLYKTENFPAVILRPFLLYGPGQGEKRFIPQIIKGCLDNQKFPTSKGEQLRDFCFISDFTQAVFLALNNNKAHGEVVNIASGKPVSIKNMINIITNLIGSGQPQFGQVAYRSGESMMLYANIDKAEKLLGWRPSIGLKQGLEDVIEWEKGNY
jgi:nucleoside-diphosphate-sugar epimerase